MKSKAARTELPRGDQPIVPGQVISELMGVIKRQFCGHMTGKMWGQWFKFLRREVVTWPAGFMWEKHFALPQDRYLRLMLSILNDIKIHGDTGRINFVPGYLQTCVQSHFRKHWEEYYREAKSAAALADLAILGMKKAAPAAGEERKGEALVHIHRALKADHLAKRKKASKPQGEQLSLL